MIVCWRSSICMTGNRLEEVLEETFSSLGLDMYYLRGEVYDGAASMKVQLRSGQLQTIIKLKCLSTTPLRAICTTPQLNLDLKWRAERRLERNPNSYGPLVNKPDYSYVDGRPVPLGQNLSRRLKLQWEYAEKIVTLSKEMDFALTRYEAVQKENKENKENIINNKLKRKGDFYKKTKKLA